MSESDNLYRLVYISRAADKTGAGDLEEILKVARAKNAELNVTGLLLFEQNHFMQVLEGSEENVTSLYQRIRADERHTNVIVILENPIEEREFQLWSMAHREIEPSETELENGFLKIIADHEGPEGSTEDKDFILRYLEVFKKVLLATK